MLMLASKFIKISKPHSSDHNLLIAECWHATSLHDSYIKGVKNIGGLKFIGWMNI